MLFMHQECQAQIEVALYQVMGASIGYWFSRDVLNLCCFRLLASGLLVASSKLFSREHPTGTGGGVVTYVRKTRKEIEYLWPKEGASLDNVQPYRRLTHKSSTHYSQQ